jgi:hypothetical protein
VCWIQLSRHTNCCNVSAIYCRNQPPPLSGSDGGGGDGSGGTQYVWSPLNCWLTIQSS